MSFETISTRSVPEYQGRLTDREIENKMTEAERRGDFDLWEEEVTPPIWEGRDFTHETVQAPAAYQIEAQPSIQEQHDNMTDAQHLSYIMTITSYQAGAHKSPIALYN